jgi:hypothetical protein
MRWHQIRKLFHIRTKVKKQPTELKKIFGSFSSESALISKIDKELKK